MVLRKMANMFDWSKKKDNRPATIPVPKRNPVLHLWRDQAEWYYETLRESVDLLSSRYEVKQRPGLEGHLSKFLSHDDPKRLKVLHSYHVRHEDRECFWLTMTFRERFREGRYMTEMDAIRQAALVTVPFDVGNALLRPENIRDRIAELFGPIDIDFEGELLFSGKYFVLAENEKRIRNYLPRSFQRLLAPEWGLLVRLCGNQALISRERSIRARDALQVAEVALAVTGCR